MPVKIIRYTDLTEDPVKQEAIKQRVLQQYGAESPMGRKALVKPQDFGIAVGDDGKASLLHLPDYESPTGYGMSVLKGLGSAAIPAAAGMVAQAGTTAMLAPAAVAGGTAATPGAGTVLGGLGALGGGIVAGAGASLGTEMLQQKALEKFIPSWAEELEIDRAINPKSNTIGAYLTGFGAARNTLSAIPGIVQKLTGKSTAGAIATEIGKRAAANAGLEAGQEMVLEDKKITELDPLRLGMSAIASPFQLKSTSTGRKLQGAGERMADALDGRGRLQAAPPVLPRSRLELAQEIQALRSQGIVDPAAYTELAAQFNGTDPARTKVNVDALSTITDSVINQARLKDPVRLQTVAADAYELLAKGGDAAALPADPTIRKIATAHNTSPLSKEQWIELATAPDVDTALLKVREGNLPAEAQKAEVAKIAADKEAAALAERERLNAGNKVGTEIADQLMNADQRRQVAEVTYTALTTGTKPPANPLSGLLAKGYADGTIETLADAQRVADANVGTDPMAATKAAKSELQKLQVEKIALLNQQAIAKRQAAEGTVEANVIRENRGDRTAQVMGEDLLAGRARNVTPLNDPSKLLGPELPPADTTARPVAPANPVVTENPQYSGAKMPPQGTAGNLYSGIPVPEIMKWLRNEDPVAVPGSVRNPPVAESAAQIDKQIELTADTASSKSSTVISPGGYIPRYIPEGLDVIKTKHGLLIFNPKKISKEVVTKATSGDVIDGRILGLGSDGSNTSAGRLAVTTSIDGVTDALGEVVRSPEEARAASVNQQRAAPGGVTSVKPVEEVLSNRQGVVQEEVPPPMSDEGKLYMRLDLGMLPLLKKLPQGALKVVRATLMRPLTAAGMPLHDRLRKMGPKGSALVDADLKMSSYERQKIAADYLDYIDIYKGMSAQDKVLLNKHDMEMKYYGMSSIVLPPELQAKSDAITRVLQRQMYDRVAEDGPYVNGERVAQLKEYYRPESTSRDAWEVITQGSADMPNVAKRTEYLNMRNDWVEHRTQQGQTVAQALSDWNEYKALLSTGNLIEGAKYNAVRRIEGFGLPASMRAPLEQTLFTHSAKTHHDVAWFKYIQQNPEMAKFVGETDDGKGGTHTYGLEEEPMSNNTNVQAWLTDVNAGRTYNNKFTRFAEALGQLATSTRLGIKTAVRDFTLTPFIAATYMEGPADLIHMARGLATTFSSSTRAAKLAGAIDPRGALSQDTMPEASPYVNAGNQIYEISQRVVNANRHLQGRAGLENKGRQWIFESGRLFALDRYGKGPAADKWFDRLEIPDWRSMNREDLADAVGTRLVQRVQGTYGREGLPPWLLQSGDQHPAAKMFFKLGRWGVERFNNWKKDAYDVAADEGNFKPLINSIVGGMLGAATIQKIEEYLWSKKPNWLTWKEWLKAPGEYKETAYKLFNEIDTGSTMGTLASLMNSVNKIAHGEKPNSLMANLGLEAADDLRIRVMQFIGAIKDGGDVMPTLAKFAQAVAEDNIQIVKVINQRMSDTNGAREERIYKRQMGETTGTVGELAPKNIMDPILPLREAKTLDEVMAATPAMTKSVMATGRAPSIQSPLRNINPDELNLAKPDYYSWLGQVQGPDVAGQQFAKDKQLDALTKFKRLAVEGAKAQTTASSLQELARKNAGPR